MRDGGFNVSHWLFAYQYFYSAVAMPYLFNLEQMPPQKENRLHKLYFVLLWLNILVPAIELGTHEYCNFKYSMTTLDPRDESMFWQKMWMGTRYTKGLLQVISGIFLLIAVA